MYEEKSIGEIFKHRREDLGQTLKDVASETSIRVGFLEAIEEGTIEKVISPAYARGFVKQYANHLGLDGDRIVKEHRLLFNTKSEKPQYNYGLGTMESRSNLSTTPKWVHFVWIGAVGALVWLAWYLAKFIGILG
jgi:cytoskeletal protein RodZ